VCGAPNVRKGMHVAFAPAGSQVGGMEIKKTKIAGFESNGMCCSEQELGLSNDHDGILDLDTLGIDFILGTPVEHVIELYDVIFEVDNKSLTNRPDLWGIYGIAREFAALTDRPLKTIPQVDLAQYENLPPIDIVIDDPACYCYCGLKVENISVKKSPLQMRSRIFACGMRGINLMADLTNYLMLELGQPMHAFDLRQVSNIRVKTFDTPFTFQTLDGNDRDINPDTLMICTSDGNPVAVAGIMGGYASDIKDDTSALLLESATFDPVSIRKSTGRLGLRTDASARYEKALDPKLADLAVARFVHLLQQCDSSVKIISGLTRASMFDYPEIIIDLKQSYIDRYTGVSIEQARVSSILRSLGFGVEETADGYQVRVPGFRATKDISIAADLVEEITRVYGYDNFEVKSTASLLAPVRAARSKTDEARVKDILVRRHNLHEAHSYVWADQAKYKELCLEIEPNVRLLNSVNPDHETLRNSMIPTLLTFIYENKGYAQAYGIFETGRVVKGLDEAGLCDERRVLGIALYAREQSEEALFFRLRHMLDELIFTLRHRGARFPQMDPAHAWQHPVNTFAIELQEQRLGHVCALHPRNGQKIDKKAAIVAAELDLGLLADIPSQPIQYHEPSKYPGIDVDLSLALDGHVYADIAEIVEEFGGEWLQSVALVDIYAPEGQRAGVTVRLSFADHARTLVRAELQPCIDRLIAELREKGIGLK